MLREAHKITAFYFLKSVVMLIQQILASRAFSSDYQEKKLNSMKKGASSFKMRMNLHLLVNPYITNTLMCNKKKLFRDLFAMVLLSPARTIRILEVPSMKRKHIFQILIVTLLAGYLTVFTGCGIRSIPHLNNTPSKRQRNKSANYTRHPSELSLRNTYHDPW